MTVTPLRAAALALALLIAGAATASASIVIDGSRVIYPESARDVSVSIRNPDPNPVLMQAWIGADERSTADSSDAPFALTPALSRIDPNGAQSLRIVGLPNTLPRDRESVFYLHVLGIPPKPAHADANYINIAVRSILKVFYRPTQLEGIPATAHQSLSWALAPDEAGHALRVHNPTGYHISFASFRVDLGGETLRQVGGGMVAPGATQTFKVPKLGAALGQKGASAYYTVIDDWGAMREFPLPL